MFYFYAQVLDLLPLGVPAAVQKLIISVDHAESHAAISHQHRFGMNTSDFKFQMQRFIYILVANDPGS
jgi:hypothetical protein